MTFYGTSFLLFQLIQAAGTASRVIVDGGAGLPTLHQVVGVAAHRDHRQVGLFGDGLAGQPLGGGGVETVPNEL